MLAYKARSNLTAMCSNCNQDKTTISSMEAKKNSPVGIEEMKIWDVISYVYRFGDFSWNDFKQIFNESNKQNQENFLKDYFREESLEMCDLCLSFLSDTYKTIKKFESLTHEASLIQQIQSVSSEKWGKWKKEETSTFLVSNNSNLSCSVKTENEDLFNSFNFADDQLSDKAGDCFIEECKYETEELFENDSPSVPFQDFTAMAMDDQSSENSTTKMPLKSAKHLVVEIEKMSKKDLEYYNEKKRTKSKCTKEVVRLNRQKIKPVKKLKCSSAIKRKYSRKQKLGMQKIPKIEIEHECNICGEKFANRFILRKEHMPTHIQDMSCKLCDKVLANIGSLRRHMKLVHRQAKGKELEKYYTTCEICGMTMHSNSIKPHMELHGPREAFKCDKCDKVYMTKHSYRDHLLTHSDNFTPFLCRHCGKTCNNKYALEKHESRHTYEKKFPCEICFKKFFLLRDLKYHISTVHSDERKFVCEECGVRFKVKYNLVTHMKNHKDVAENGEYTTKCTYCDRVFKHSHSLRRHLKIHQKIYTCSFCGKTFSNRTHLRNHEDLHKKNPDYQPRKCKINLN